MTKKATVFGYDGCRYCELATALLRQIGAPFDYLDVKTSPDNAAFFRLAAPDATTVPQIFIGEIHVGGYDDLNAAFVSGRLKELLGE